MARRRECGCAQSDRAELASEMGGRVGAEFAADHLGDDAGRRGRGDGLGGDMAAVAEDGDMIAKGEELLEAMRHIDKREAAGLELADEAKKIGGLGGGKRARGFVHHDDLRAGADGGGDLNELFPTR